MILGVLCALYFLLIFDTSVAVPTTDFMGTTIGGGRVNNLGLMSTRSNGIMFGFGLAILGAIAFFTTKDSSGQAISSSITSPQQVDSSSTLEVVGYAILSLMLPIGGLVLWLINKGKNPKKANAAGIGGLIGFILGMLFVLSSGNG